MVEVICDTNFLIHLATKRIKNIDRIDVEIGPITYIVPIVVHNELVNLKNNKQKKQEILVTLDFIKHFKNISISGKFADKELINYIKNNGGIVGTMDKELKKEIKKNGGSIISFSNDRMVLEH